MHGPSHDLRALPAENQVISSDMTGRNKFLVTNFGVLSVVPQDHLSFDRQESYERGGTRCLGKRSKRRQGHISLHRRLVRWPLRDSKVWWPATLRRKATGTGLTCSLQRRWSWPGKIWATTSSKQGPLETAADSSWRMEVSASRCWRRWVAVARY